MFEFVQGDLIPGLEIDLTELDVPVPIALDASVTMRWRKPDGSTVTNVALVIVDFNNGVVVKSWNAGDTDIAGIHRAQVAVVSADGAPQTYPSDNSFVRWIVHKRIV